MLWFSKQKGLATGISIMGFGLAKAIATPIMEAIQNNIGIAEMFYILGAVYFGLYTNLTLSCLKVSNKSIVNARIGLR